jgi:lambda repressor-like predicted transcriptional regulator
LVELLHLYWDGLARTKRLAEMLRAAQSARRPMALAGVQRVRQWRLDAATCAELVTAYERGSSVKDLQLRFGVHRHTVTAVLRRHHVILRVPGLSPEETAAAIQLYASGLSLAKVAEQFGLEQRSVRRSLMLAGVLIRPPGRRPAA